MEESKKRKELSHSGGVGGWVKIDFLGFKVQPLPQPDLRISKLGGGSSEEGGKWLFKSFSNTEILKIVLKKKPAKKIEGQKKMSAKFVQKKMRVHSRK